MLKFDSFLLKEHRWRNRGWIRHLVGVTRGVLHCAVVSAIAVGVVSGHGVLHGAIRKL